MKQVIVYNQIKTRHHNGQTYTDESLFKFFRCHIDWSLHLGWKKEDIIIGTNFDFEYNGVKNHQLKDICWYSGYNNFWYGALELMRNGVITEDFWLHDHDSWPNRYFEFPKFDGEIGGCEYQGTPQWNCATIYLKKTSIDILEYIVSILRENPDIPVSSDEEWIAFCRFNPQSQIREYFSSLDTRYNCGITYFEKRYENATKPINVFSFRPDAETYKVVEPYVDSELKNIFKIHGLEL